LVLMDLMDHLVHLVLMDLMDHLVHLVLMDPKVRWVQRDKLRDIPCQGLVLRERRYELPTPRTLCPLLGLP
jgi:hypothetical protein